MTNRKNLVIATHSGKFHMDECMAIALLQWLFTSAVVWRTRDPQIYSEADIVVDVGKEYDPKRHRYDHHQESRVTIRDICEINDDVELSSCGMVFGHFGTRVIAKVLNFPLSHPAIRPLFERIYYRLIRMLCLVDNGEGFFPKNDYTLQNLTRICNLNFCYRSGAHSEDQLFCEAVMRCQDVFRMVVRQEQWLLYERWPTCALNWRVVDVRGLDFSKWIALSCYIVPHEVLAACVLMNTAEYSDYDVVMSDYPDFRASCGVDLTNWIDESPPNFFEEVLGSEYEGPLSCAGRIFVRFGPELIRNAIQDIAPDLKHSVDVDDISTIFRNCYADLVKQFDHACNSYNGSFWNDAKLPFRLNVLNDTRMWDPEVHCFGPKKAFQMAREELFDVIGNNVRYHLYHYPIVLQALDNRKEVHPSGKVILIPQAMKFNFLLKKAEAERGLVDQIQLVILNLGVHEQYMVCSVKSYNRRNYRVKLATAEFPEEGITFHHDGKNYAECLTKEKAIRFANWLLWTMDHSANRGQG